MDEDTRNRKRKFGLKNPKKVLPQIFASTAAAIAFMNTGFLRGWSSPGIPSLVDSKVMELSTEDISWISSLPLVGAFIGSFLAGIPMDKLGRRRTLLFASPLFTLGWLTVGFATNKWMVFIGRVVMGVMSGVGNPASQIYIAECSSPRIRGALGSFTAVSLGLGILLGYLFGWFLPWNHEAILITFFPIVQGICMFFAPYSPVWLLTKGKNEEAKAELQKFRGRDADTQAEYNRILDNIEKNKDKSKVGLREFLSPAILKPASISFVLMLFQQISGFNAIIYYNATIFGATGSVIDRNLSSVIIGSLLLVCTASSIPLVDKAGRRVLLLVSSASMVVSLGAMGTYFYLKEIVDPSTWDVAKEIGWLPLASLIIYIIAFSFGFNSVPFLIMGEMLPVKFRSSLGGLTSGFNLFTGFLVVKTFPFMVETVGNYGTFWFYGSSCVVGFVFIYFSLPETKGKTIEEIEAMFAGSSRRSGDVEETNEMLGNKPPLDG